MPTNFITGTANNDTLVGTAAADRIEGLGGDDLLIDELGGADELFGGDGNDVIRVSNHGANVTIDGGAGDDYISVLGTVSDLGTNITATVTLGAGSDVVGGACRLTVLDFTPGDGGDRLNWTPILAVLRNWDQASNPFAGGLWLRAIQNDNSLVIQYSALGDGVNWADYAYLVGVTAAQLTAFNLSGLALDGSAPTNLSLTGGAGNDRLYGLAGNDTIDGAAGNDSIYAGIGNDIVHGGANDDYIDGELGSDNLYGEDGDDTIIDNVGDLGTMDGGAGNDTLTVDLQPFLFTAGPPILNPYKFVRTVLGGEGDDRITFIARQDTQATIDGGIGDDDITYRTSATNTTFAIQGGDGNDRIDAIGPGTIDAGAGNDLVIVGDGAGSSAGSPTITLGSGVDTVRLNPFMPLSARITDFQTGAGGDVVDLTNLAGAMAGWHHSGNPVFLVQSGNDVKMYLVTMSSQPRLIFENRTVAQFTAENLGGFPTDGSEPAGATINGTAGDDDLTGTVGDDTISGLGGNDVIHGGFNEDILYGGDGDDMLESGGADDRLEGGDGNDILVDRVEDNSGDTMIGGGGNDTLTVYREIFTASGISLDGGDGDDLIEATRATGTILGGAGNDVVHLVNVTATVDLGAGDDVLTAFGGTLTGGGRSLTLGAGRDVVTPTEKNVVTMTVTDFQAGEAGDRLDLSVAWGPNPFGVTLTIIQQGADALIRTTGGSTRYTLLGVNATDLSSYNLGVSTSLFYNPAARNFTGTPAADSYISADGNDTLSGLAGADTLYGAGGNDVIDGGADADLLYGGTGNDTYFVDNAGDRAIESAGQGTDIVYASLSYALEAGSSIEILSTTSNGGTGAIDLTGNELANTIYGNDGINNLRGGGGSGDVLIGLGGNDVYFIVAGNEAVFEAAGGGTDIVYTEVSHALAAGQEIELLSTISNAATTAMDLTGNEFANTIYGNNGVNNLRGGGGAGDFLIGLGGNDVYFIVSGTEQLFEAAGGGSDVVYTNVSHALVSGQEIEILSAISNSATNAMDLTGNEFANVIYGNNGVNNLRGGGGADTMVGFGGNDVYYIVSGTESVVEGAGGGSDVVYTNVSYALAAGQEIEYFSAVSTGAATAMDLTGNAFGNQIHGNNGVNVINGGSGEDLLVGYGGADSFAFTTALGGGNVDTLGDFLEGSDKILLDDAIFTGLGLGQLSANAFVIGPAQDADDRIIYNSGTGAILFDADGNGAGAAVQFAWVPQATLLTANDFIVI